MKKHIAEKAIAAILALTCAGCVHAEERTYTAPAGPYAWRLENFEGGTFTGFGGKTVSGLYYENQGKITIFPDITGYCADPTCWLDGSAQYERIALEAWDQVNETVKDRLNKIAYFGFGYEDHTDEDWYWAAQGMIWETITGGSCTWYENNEVDGTVKDLSREEEEIERLIREYEAVPEIRLFRNDGTEADGTVQAGERIEVRDLNRTNAAFRVTDRSEGLTITDADGKTPDEVTFPFYLTASKASGNVSVTLEKIVPDRNLRSAFVLNNNENQLILAEGTLMQDPSVIAIRLSVADTETRIVKLDETGTAVIGAHLALKDKDGNVLEEWVTDGSEHMTESLVIGERYTVSETETPDGYYPSENISFQADEKNVILMEDQRICLLAEKTDQKGTPLAGAKLSLCREDGTVVTEWTSSKTPQDLSAFVHSGERYFIREQEAPAGYAIAEDVFFTVDDHAPEEPLRIILKDEPLRTSVRKMNPDGYPVCGAELSLLDEDGRLLDRWITDEEPHDISSVIQEGMICVLRETGTPDGWYPCEDLTFRAAANETQITLTDAPVRAEILKTDTAGNPLAGITLRLTDVTDEPQEIITFETGEEPYAINCAMIAGHTYELSETDWQEGLHSAASMRFRIPEQDPGQPVRVTMTDLRTAISFLKTKEDGTPLEGAKLAILDAEDQTLITRFTSGTSAVTKDDEGREIAGMLKGGKTYILHEEEAPYGYCPAEDITFTMSGDENTAQQIVMQDPARTITITVRKQDENRQPLSGAVIGLYQEGEKISEALTDDHGEAVFETVSVKGLTVREIRAPEGYVLDNTAYAVPDEDHVLITITDRETPEVPDTGDHLSGWFFAALISVLLASFTYVLLRRHREG